MFAYNPTVNDRSGEIIGTGMVGAAQTNAQMMSDLGQNIGGAISAIGGAYAENKAMKAKAQGYSQIADILGSSMFQNNDAVQGYLGELRKNKDPYAQVMGYEQLFNVVGPLSNWMNMQRSSGVREQGQQLTAALPELRNQADAAARAAAGENQIQGAVWQRR